MRNHFQLQNYYFSTKFCAFNHIILKAKGNQRGAGIPGDAVVPGGAVVSRGCSCLQGVQLSQLHQQRSMRFKNIGAVETTAPPEMAPPDKKNPRSPEGPRGNTPVGVDGFEPPTLCL